MGFDLNLLGIIDFLVIVGLRARLWSINMHISPSPLPLLTQETSLTKAIVIKQGKYYSTHMK